MKVRTDNQLRGRSGRQGDPGESKFFLSLEDDLMRIFGSEKLDTVLLKLGLKKGEAIIHTWVNRAILKTQEKFEGRNFEIRKNVLKFDQVLNQQREVIYKWRRNLLTSDDISDLLNEWFQDIKENLSKNVEVHKKSYESLEQFKDQVDEELNELLSEDNKNQLLSNLKIEQTIAGGSVANYIVGLSQLGNKVGFIGKVNDDNLGIKYEEGLKKEKVKYFYSKKKEDLPTGTCLILITPDSERTMCTFLGTAGKINENDVDIHSVKNSEITY